jgi:polyisoprenoid-binding protein YceI
VSAISPADRLAGTWEFAAVHSSAQFAVRYLVANFRGSFTDLDARLEGGALSGSVKVSSVTIKEPNLIAHLRSPEFFDAERFPEITFECSDLRIEGDTISVDGEMTIKGTRLPVHADGTVEGPIEDFVGNLRLGFALETTISRSAFGVSWNADLPKGGKALSDDVRLTIELEFQRVSA